MASYLKNYIKHYWSQVFLEPLWTALKATLWILAILPTAKYFENLSILPCFCASLSPACQWKQCNIAIPSCSCSSYYIIGENWCMAVRSKTNRLQYSFSSAVAPPAQLYLNCQPFFRCQHVSSGGEDVASRGTTEEAELCEWTNAWGGTRFTASSFSHVFFCLQLIHLPLLGSPCVQDPQIPSPSPVIIETTSRTIPHPHNQTHTQETLPIGVIHAAWGVMGDYEWDRSMWWFTHTSANTHMRQLIIDEGLLTSPLLLGGHPAANEDTQTPSTVSTTSA